MNKILLCLGICMLSLAGCGDNILVESMTDYDYIYVNKCSMAITITSFAPSYDEGYKPGDEYTFKPSVTSTIPTDGKETFTAMLPGAEPPVDGAFSWGYLKKRVSYTTFSNGEKVVTHKSEDAYEEIPANNLYLNKNYLRIGDKTFLYVFTDDFFADGEPVEPAAPEE